MAQRGVNAASLTSCMHTTAVLHCVRESSCWGEKLGADSMVQISACHPTRKAVQTSRPVLLYCLGLLDALHFADLKLSEGQLGALA